MGEGKGLSQYVLIGAIMFGLLVGAGATAIFGDEVGSFVGGLVKSNCVVATDEDFSGTVNGEFMYIGSDECVKIPHVIKGVEVTSYKDMFRGTKVSKVVSDNLNVTNMEGMFFSSEATELDLSSFNTSNVTNMSRMFVASKATELDLSSFDTSNVTSMEFMFGGSQAKELDVSSFNTSNVTNMSGMFGSSQATEIKGLEDFNTSNVTNMSWMFADSEATELDVSRFNTSNVTNMEGMFFESQATELDVSSFDTSNVTDMSGMFEDSNAKKVYARTQLDADKFNASGNKPNGLQVIVRQ